VSIQQFHLPSFKTSHQCECDSLTNNSLQGKKDGGENDFILKKDLLKELTKTLTLS
jgi:hypothetical protein